MSTDLREDAYQDAVVEGKHARRSGDLATDNPHPAGCSESRAWETGWHSEDSFIASGGVEGINDRFAAKVLADRFNMIVGRAADRRLEREA